MDKKTDVSTPKKILHIGNPADTTWITILRNALTPLGQLDSISKPEIPLHVQQKHYDLIIIDAATLNDVETLVTALHQQEPNIPIVVVTTSPTWQRARRVLLAGAADYIRKSLDTDSLLTTFRAILTK
jgi:DNA-binding NarL/FixJ family response regulator